nr:circadian locomoter output cycles protein kaput-like isoform X2 [Dermacentor andersoni]
MCHDLCLYHPHQSFSDQLSAWSNKGSLRLKPMFLLGELPTFVKILRPLLSDEPLANVEASVVGPLLIILSFCEPFILFGLLFQSLEGFLLVLSLSGQILYTSESVASLLGYLPHELHNIFILDILHESNHGAMCEVLSSASSQGAGIMRQDGPQETYVSVDLYMKRGNLGSTDSSVIYEPMNLKGTFLTAVGEGFPLGGLEYDSNSCSSACSPNTGSAEQQAPCLVAMVRLQTPQLMHELILCDGSRNEFSSRHSLEWKFLFLDHRAPPIIGYLPFEVLGTSGYDYYHVEDLEKVAAGQEALMQTGEGTSCHYRFLTKGQQWIWLQTRYYITYHQWSSKPEFVVCTNTVMSYDEDLTHSKAAPTSGASASYSRTSVPNRTSYQSSRVSSAPSVSSRDSLSPNLSEKSGCAGGVMRDERSSGAGSCGNQLSLPFTEACTITRESPATGGRLVSLASSEPSSSRLQHEPMDQRPPYQTTTACRAPLITLTALQPIAATFAGSGHCGTAAAAAAVQASSATGELLGVPGERLTHQHETRALTAAGAGVAPVAAAAVGRWTTTPAAAAAAGPFPGLPSAQAPGAAATDPQAAGGIAPGLRAANARALHQPQPDGHCDERQRSAFHAVPADDDAVGTNVDDRRTDGCVDAGTLFAGYGSRRLYGQLLPEGLDAPHAEPAATAPATDAARAAAATAAGPPKFGLFGNRSSGICCSGVPAPAAHGPNDIHFKF